MYGSSAATPWNRTLRISQRGRSGELDPIRGADLFDVRSLAGPADGVNDPKQPSTTNQVEPSLEGIGSARAPLPDVVTR